MTLFQSGADGREGFECGGKVGRAEVGRGLAFGRWRTSTTHRVDMILLFISYNERIDNDILITAS